MLRNYLGWCFSPEDGAGGVPPATEPSLEEMNAEIEKMRQEKDSFEKAEAERIRAEYAELKRWKETIFSGVKPSTGYESPAQNPLDGRTDIDRKLDDRYANGGAKMFYGDSPTREQIRACRLMAGMAEE